MSARTARCAPVRTRWRQRQRQAKSAVAASSIDDEAATLWLIVNSTNLHASPNGNILCAVSKGEVVEGEVVGLGSEWVRLHTHCAFRLSQLSQYQGNFVEEGVYLKVHGTATADVSLFGGRLRSTGDFWFAREAFASVLRRQPTPLVPSAPIAALKRMTTVSGRKGAPTSCAARALAASDYPHQPHGLRPTRHHCCC